MSEDFGEAFPKSQLFGMANSPLCNSGSLVDPARRSRNSTSLPDYDPGYDDSRTGIHRARTEHCLLGLDAQTLQGFTVARHHRIDSILPGYDCRPDRTVLKPIAPTGIVYVEIVEAIVAISIIVLGALLFREKTEGAPTK